LSDILAQILEQKYQEVAIALEVEPLAELERKVSEIAPPLDFFWALQTPRIHSNIALIAEVKKASPSKGLLCPDFDPAKLAKAYAEAGASAISVLTDEHFFQGHLSYLEVVKQSAGGNIPVLRKDFMVDPYQVWQARAYGADAILLIMAALEDGQAAELFDLATELAMASLVEVHNSTELQRAVQLGANIIGINNRNLRDFHTDLAITENLVSELGANQPYLIVSESGIATAADIERLDTAGVRAVLIGETLVRAAGAGGGLDTAKIGETVRQLFSS
jgi:indole-3-glycerol phosphate synthase